MFCSSDNLGPIKTNQNSRIKAKKSLVIHLSNLDLLDLIFCFLCLQLFGYWNQNCRTFQMLPLVHMLYPITLWRHRTGGNLKMSLNILLLWPRKNNYTNVISDRYFTSWFLRALKDGDSTNSPGNLFQCFTLLPIKLQFIPIISRQRTWRMDYSLFLQPSFMYLKIVVFLQSSLFQVK